jgi:hypothetical protein
VKEDPSEQSNYHKNSPNNEPTPKAMHALAAKSNKEIGGNRIKSALNIKSQFHDQNETEIEAFDYQTDKESEDKMNPNKTIDNDESSDEDTR